MKAKDLVYKNNNEDAQFFEQKVSEEELKEQQILDTIKNNYINFALTHKKQIEKDLIDFF